MALTLITCSVRSTYTHKPRFYRNILASLHFKARDSSLSLSVPADGGRALLRLPTQPEVQAVGSDH